MDIRKIKTLIEMLEASNLNEIEVSQGEESVRISKSSGEIKVLQDSNIGINNEPQSINKIDNNQIENEIKGNQVTSPIVGTFYRKPSPDKEPFVKVGDIVNKGDVLCIIEAMKMMNEIKSEFDGKISSIEVDDGQPVEFGQTIIVIE
ncbi:MAG: acetyl-CoA carboxylase biotin carboxyl carrier protein [Pseudomonadota bacterium]|jgi:acetyl-CoA carboxylase biotin carboxyl carrier protein|nr:acetyl-CoA carboxylase, biotin carboxyl carrier protein [Gammaproteobacteria bacterium]MEC7774166.1 acetyl-CoA carboxylase biotin carboxyl carrier protein [Pseudomonadota bacterium]MEC8131568.1 acetyl-CoA carboxylase biotin carboxyl carrier protein [Pseudomonadota bacterium]GIS48541.1 MAG: acetyl-CoA carboxylase biotin carboxyl carrier protein subunit [Gammaproteobacteria bacterium]|tara:strand:+ start:986 stop:1426 length:441 start_codon:yes stop_codon:yes gene_type:complete